MTFERFIYSSKKTPVIKLTKNKELFFDQNAIKLFDLYQNKNIALYYNKSKNLIGLKSERNDQFDNYKVLFHEKTDKVSIIISSFIDHYNIKYIPGDYKLIQKQNIYCIDLNSKI